MKINKLNKDLIPLKHLSPSSMIEYLTNEKAFFTKYIKGDFGDNTSPTLAVGSAFHSAMELYYTAIITKRDKPDFEIPDKDTLIQHAVAKFKKEISFAQKRGIENLFKKKCRELEKDLDFDKFYDYYNRLIGMDWSGFFHLQDAISEEGCTDDQKKSFTELNSIVTMAKDYVNQLGFELDEYSGLYNEELEFAKDRYIDWNKTGCIESSIEEIEILINNYIDNLPELNPIFAEIGDTCEFQDFDGNDMMIPIKGKPDLIADYEGEEILVDFKTVSGFTEQITGSYEIQAGSYYFIHQKITGRKPKKMIYVEVVKKELNPAKGLKKPDLQGLCINNDITYKKTDTNAILIEKLMTAGKLVIPNPVRIIEVDFEKNPEVVQVFIEIFKEILNRTYYYFIEKTLKFLPNPKADYTGLESWEEYKREVICEIDPVEEFQNMLKKTENIKIEF